MTETRERIIETTCNLLEVQGYQATGLNQIVEESGAPKGSLYYYFPDGKEGLIAEAIERTMRIVANRIEETLASVEEPADAVRTFILTLSEHVEASGFRSGGPITTVALEAASTSERLNRACQEAYQRWQNAFRKKLLQGGYSQEQSARLATIIVASIEGAIILSRTQRSIAPLEDIAEELHFLLEQRH